MDGEFGSLKIEIKSILGLVLALFALLPILAFWADKLWRQFTGTTETPIGRGVFSLWEALNRWPHAPRVLMVAVSVFVLLLLVIGVVEFVRRLKNPSTSAPPVGLRLRLRPLSWMQQASAMVFIAAVILVLYFIASGTRTSRGMEQFGGALIFALFSVAAFLWKFGRLF